MKCFVLFLAAILSFSSWAEENDASSIKATSPWGQVSHFAQNGRPDPTNTPHFAQNGRPDPTNTPANKLTFTAGGEIVAQSGKISVGNGGAISITTATGDMYSLNIPIGVKGGKTHWTAGDLDDRKVVVDADKKETAFTANIVDKALTTSIPVRFGTSLTPEGKARITMRYESKEPIDKLLSMGGVIFFIQRSEMIGSQITIDGISTPIVALTTESKTVNLNNANKPRNIVFASDDPYRSVSVHVVTAQNVQVRDEIYTFGQEVGMRVGEVDNQIILDVDLPPKAQQKSAETYAGVDFYAAEKTHLPQYNLSRNLIQNSGFEQGFQYWNFGNLGNVKGNRFPDNYLITTEQCHSGNKCLKILGEKGEGSALLATFAIPVEAGKDYTVSFYAKGDRPKLQIMTSVFPSAAIGGPSWKGFPITQEWQRYHYTFKAPSGALSMQFGIGYPGEDCIGLLDDIQLEQGALSEYTQKPVELAFVTEHRNNLFKPDEAIKGRWEISGKPDSMGTIAITLHNFAGAIISTHHDIFKINSNGSTSINQSWLEHQPRGLYTLEANIKLEDGFATREYGRLSIAPPADPTVKHHTLFATGGVQTRQGSWDRKLALLEYYGIGSAMNFDPIPHDHLALMKKHHITNVTSIFDGGDHIGEIKLTGGWDGNETELAIIEAAAYVKAKAYPEIIYWKLVNEPRTNMTADATKQWIVALTAAYQGIKRANPSAQVLSVDPANMQPDGGIAMLDKYLAAGGDAITDIIAIHPYRTRPEVPDMDADMITLLAMLKRHNYQGEIWFTEGGGHMGMLNPLLGMNVHASLSDQSWRIGNLTYDIGEGERYAAAYAVRAWLVGLKYGDRVKQQVDWVFGNGIIDYNGTADVRAVSLNTLTNMLGNADFIQDIKLDSNTRCYLFKDSQQNSVAVIWNLDPKKITSLHLGAFASKLHIVNMVGETIKTDKNKDILISPYPVYLSSNADNVKKLETAIKAGLK